MRFSEGTSYHLHQLLLPPDIHLVNRYRALILDAQDRSHHSDHFLNRSVHTVSGPRNFDWKHRTDNDNGDLI